MPKEDPRAEIRRILADMKAKGITISTSPDPGSASTYGERAMGVIDEEARALDMTFESEPRR